MIGRLIKTFILVAFFKINFSSEKFFSLCVLAIFGAITMFTEINAKAVTVANLTAIE